MWAGAQKAGLLRQTVRNLYVLCGICLRADSLCATAEVFVHFEFESAGTSFRGTLAAGGQVQSLASCMCLGGNIPSEKSLTAAPPQTARSPVRSLPQPPPPSTIQRKLPLDGAAWRRWRGFGRWRPPRMRTRRRALSSLTIVVTDKESDFAAHPIGAHVFLDPGTLLGHFSYNGMLLLPDQPRTSAAHIVLRRCGRTGRDAGEAQGGGGGVLPLEHEEAPLISD